VLFLTIGTTQPTHSLIPINL